MSQLSDARALMEVPLSDEGSVSGSGALSGPERIFCDMFVSNGGKGTEAALAAGYAAGSAQVAASRLLCRKRVADHLDYLSRRFLHAAIPLAIKALMDIATDTTATPASRIKAANSLLERGGLAAPTGGVNVSVAVQMNGSQAQQLIGSVWDAKQSRMSDIPPAMSDSIEALANEVERIEDGDGNHPADEARGGIRIAGPVPESSPIAGYSSAQPPKTDEFRRAFEDDGDDA